MASNFFWGLPKNHQGMFILPTTFWTETFSVQNGLLTAAQNGKALNAITVYSFNHFRDCFDAVLDPLFPPPEKKGARKIVRQISEAALKLEHMVRDGGLNAKTDIRRQLNIIGMGLMRFNKTAYQEVTRNLKNGVQPKSEKTPMPKPELKPVPAKIPSPSKPRSANLSIAKPSRYLTVTEFYKEIGSHGKLATQLQQRHALDDFSRPATFAIGLSQIAIEFAETDPELSSKALSALIHGALLTLKMPFYLELEDKILKHHSGLFKPIHAAELMSVRSRVTMPASISRYERFEMLLKNKRPDLFPEEPFLAQPLSTPPPPVKPSFSQIRQWVEEIRTEYPTLYAHLEKNGAFEWMNPPNRFAEVLKEVAVSMFKENPPMSYAAVACIIIGALVLHRHPFRAALDMLIQNHFEVFQSGHKKVLGAAKKMIGTQYERAIWDGFAERLKAKRSDLFQK